MGVATLTSPEYLFETGNMLALAGWVILIFLPRRWRIIWIPHFIIPAVLAFAYAPLVMANIYTLDGGFSSIESVRALFQNDAMLTAGWLHYLAFDLFVGSWIAVQSDKAGISRIIQPIFLIGAFMFGPIGYLLFIITRTAMAGLPWRAAEKAAS